MSHSTVIKTSDVLSDGTGHITTRVHPQGSNFLTRREEDDLRRRVSTQYKPPERPGDSWNCQLLPFALPFHTSRTTEHPGFFLESTDIQVRSLTGYSLTHRTSGRFSRKLQHLSLVNYLELEDLPNIREVSQKTRNLSSGIFLELVNLPNILEVLPSVLLSQVPLCVFILPFVLLNFVNRHATKI